MPATCPTSGRRARARGRGRPPIAVAGVEATVTDANVVLGRLGSDTDLAGGVHLDTDAARAAVARFADRLGLGIDAVNAGWQLVRLR